MQFCPACGAQQNQAGQFCRGCGADLRSVRTALQSPVPPTDTARLEIARAMTAKIAALDPSDRRLAKKIQTIRAESEKMLDSPEGRRKTFLMYAIAFIGGGTICVLADLVKKFLDRGESGAIGGIFFLMFCTLVITLLSLVITHFFPRNRQSERADLRGVPLPPVSVRTAPTSEISNPQPMLAPPSVTEGTTYNLPPMAVPVPVAERNTR